MTEVNSLISNLVSKVILINDIELVITSISSSSDATEIRIYRINIISSNPSNFTEYLNLEINNNSPFIPWSGYDAGVDLNIKIKDEFMKKAPLFTSRIRYIAHRNVDNDLRYNFNSITELYDYINKSGKFILPELNI